MYSTIQYSTIVILVYDNKCHLVYSTYERLYHRKFQGTVFQLYTHCSSNRKINKKKGWGWQTQKGEDVGNGPASGVGDVVCRRCGSGVDIASCAHQDDGRYSCRMSGKRTDSVGEKS